MALFELVEPISQREIRVLMPEVQGAGLDASPRPAYAGVGVPEDVHA